MYKSAFRLSVCTIRHVSLLCVCVQKGTKNALETGRTFATLFSDVDLRYQLFSVHSSEEFNNLLWEHTKKLTLEHATPPDKRRESKTPENPHIAPMPEEV